MINIEAINLTTQDTKKIAEASPAFTPEELKAKSEHFINRKSLQKPK